MDRADYGAVVVGRGIETAAQRTILRVTGCEFGRGHLFGKPMDASRFRTSALIDLAGSCRNRESDIVPSDPQWRDTRDRQLQLASAQSGGH